MVLTIRDDDTRGVTVSESALSLKEMDNIYTVVKENAPGSYTVKLTSQPTGTVRIAVASDDVTVATVEPSTLTFTPANWNTPQTVTVTPVDDTIDNPNNQRSATITHRVSGGDYGSNSVSAGSVAVTVAGDDEMTVIASKTTMPLGESAGVGPTQDTYTVKLSGPPFESPALLLLLIETGDSSVATVGSDLQRRIFFTPSNWNTPQTVTIAAVNDDVDNPNDVRTATINHRISHPFYRLSVSSSVAISVADDDSRGVTVSTRTVSVKEADDPASSGKENEGSYTVVLTSQPTGTVNISVLSDAAVVGVRPSPLSFTSWIFNLTFTPDTWETPQTVEVAAVDDAIDNANNRRSTTISHVVAGADYGSNNVSAASVAVTVEDDDVAGVTVSETVLSLSEGDDTGTGVKENEGSYTVVLTSQPTGTVNISVLSDAAVVGVRPSTLSSTSWIFNLTFTPATWETPQTVAVAAVDDAIDNANNRRSTTISHVVAGADYGSNNVSAASVAVTVEDDDVAGVTVSETVLSLSEGDDTGTGVKENQESYTVVLTSQPTGNVTVTPSSGAASVATVEPATLTFTPANWHLPWTVAVLAVDDAIDNPNDQRLTTITHGVSGADYGSNSVSAGSVVVTVRDDDAAPSDISLSVNPATVDEGAPTTVTVTAAVSGASTFSEDVTMTVSVGQTGDTATAGSDYATVTAFPLTIPSGSATGSATFTLSPTDDDLDENDETVTVSGTVTNITVSDATLIIRDNDLVSSGVSLAVSPETVSERMGTVEITVTATLNGDTRSVATLVTVTVGSGTAVEGTDFDTVDDFTITIPADTLSNTATFSLTPTDDTTGDGNETVAVNGSTTVSGLSVTGTTVTITNDDTAPTVAITVDDHLLGIDETATVTVAFSEPVTGFTAGDLTASDGVLSDFRGNDGDSVYTATLSPPPNGSGTITLNVAANVAQDGQANGNKAAAPLTLAYDTIAPTVVVTVDDTLLGIDETATVTVTFSEPVTGFTAEDLTASDGILSDFSGSDGDSVYRFTLSPPANGSGTITLTVAANVAEDRAGNGNEAAEPLTLAYDTIAPTVLITVDDHMLDVGETATVTVTFSEPVTGFTAEELTASDGILSDLSGSDGDSVYTATLIPPAYGSGTITLNVAANVAQDRAGNGNEAAEPVTVTYDTISSLLHRIATQFLARVGRTIGAQVLESVDNRLQKPAAGNELVVGGQQFERFEDLFMDDRFFNVLKTGDLLSDTSFHLSTGNGDAAELEMNGDWTLWGDVARTHTTGEDNDLSMTVDLLTTTVGLDRQHDRWLWGIGLSHSEAWGSFTDTSAAEHSGGEDLKGKTAASVTALHPYLSIQPHDNLELFGMAGYGWGSMSLDPELDSAKDYASALRMYMVAVGGRGFLSSEPGWSLYGKGDVLLVRTEAEKEIGGKPVAAEALRARMALETVVEEQLREGVAHSLTFESGLRYDAGDAEQGFGVELGAGWSYSNAERDLKLSLRAHGLLTHQEGLAFQDLGVSGSLYYGGGVDDLGLRLSLSPSWGNPDSGVDRLWNDQTWRNFITNDDAATDDRRTGQMEGEIGYGFAVLAGEGVLTPYAGMTWSENGWDWQLGSRLHLDPALNFDLSLSRKDRPSQPGDDYEILLSVQTAW